MEYIGAFSMGFLGGLHCVFMCGPIITTLNTNKLNNNIYAHQLFYNLSRTVTYTVLGLVVGLVGIPVQLFGLQQKLSLSIGVIILLVFFLPKIMPTFFVKSHFSQIYTHIAARLRQALYSTTEKRYSRYIVAGALNGLLPCGLVYIAILASVGMASPFSSALFMFLFGLGTVPIMFLMGLSGKAMFNHYRPYFNKAIPVVVVLISALFILRGLNLDIPYISPAIDIERSTEVPACN